MFIVKVKNLIIRGLRRIILKIQVRIKPTILDNLFFCLWLDSLQALDVNVLPRKKPIIWIQKMNYYVKEMCSSTISSMLGTLQVTMKSTKKIKS